MYRVITISREFGSGGRTIGREVARQLGIKCYDSELIEKIAEESGACPRLHRRQGRVRRAFQLVCQRVCRKPFLLGYVYAGLSVDGAAENHP